MPQVDLETLVCGGGDPKIACETQIEDGGSFPSSPEPPPTPPDFPAESFYLSKEDELDWFDRNAFYERKESTKGNSANSISNNSNSTTTTTSTSQRFSMNLKSKTSIIGLPKAPQTSTFTPCKNRHKKGKPSNARFFPKRTRSKSSVPETTEPSSPKVSCMGRVRSQRQRLRQLSRQRSLTVRSVKKVGFWGNLKSVLCSRCRSSGAVNVVEGSTESPTTPSKKSEKRKSPSPSQSSELAPSLNELKRFASGRKFDSMGGCGGNLEVDESDTADERGRRVSGPYRGN